MVSFVPLTEPEFEEWKNKAVKEYAADRAKVGDDEEGQSQKVAEKEFNSLLPYGLQSSGQYLYSVVDDRDGKKVGLIWLGELPMRNDTLYIYGIEVGEQFRGRGYGTATLKLAEEKARSLGKKRIGLHVFGHNERAYKLYKALGYNTAHIGMTKQL